MECLSCPMWSGCNEAPHLQVLMSVFFFSFFGAIAFIVFVFVFLSSPRGGEQKFLHLSRGLETSWSDFVFL